MKTRSIDIPVGEHQMQAYIATPDDGSHPAVIVLQEIFGVNTEIQRITDLLASVGYVAVAINYYHRTHPHLNVPYNQEGMQVGIEAAKQVHRATLREDLLATIAWLNKHPNVDQGRIASWGFCMGGSVAFYSATIPGVKAAISFYGGCIAAPFFSGEPEALSDTPALQAPLLLVYGSQDEHIPATARERIGSTLSAAGKTYEMKVYADEDHGFFRQSSQAFDDANVSDAWMKVQTFLSQI